MTKNDRSEYDSELEYMLHKIKPLRIIATLVALVIAITAITGITNVDSTEAAVVFHKNNGSLSIMGPGYHYRIPIIQSITKYNVRETTYTESAVGISLDLQETTTEVTVRYSPDAQAIQTIHQKLGTSYEKKVVVPAVQSCVKDAVSHYNVEQLTGAIRVQVNDNIDKCIRKELSDGYLIVEKVSVTDFDFSSQFNHAIEAKAIAQQAAQEERNRLEQVRYQANQTIIKAQAQAEAQRLLNEATLTDNGQGNAYLFLEWLKVWDGKLPTVMTGEGNNSLLITPPSATS